MKKIISLLFIGLLLASLNYTNAFAENGDKKDPKLFAVIFYADWCSACKAIAPSVMDLQDQLKNESVKFVKFDFTNSKTKQSTVALAKELGLDKILKENNGTGYVLLVNPENKERLAKFTKQYSTKQMYDEINKYL